MNNLDYYDRQKEPWEEIEDKSVRSRYETKEMNISQIADIHRRTPGSISYKLRSLGIIKHNTLARGYLEYKNSNLYKEIVNRNQINDKHKRENHRKKIEGIETTNTTNYTDKKISREKIKQIPSDIIQIKNDIKEINENINKLFELIKILKQPPH